MAVLGKILVTGASGFLGSHVIRRLVDLKYPVRAFARRGVDAGCESVSGDILDEGAIDRAMDGITHVVHCIANFGPDFDDAARVNVAGTEALARAALRRGCARFVHLSSIGVYDIRQGQRLNESAPMWPYERNPLLAYSVTKAQAERALASVARLGLPTVVLRPGNILGPDRRCAHTYALARGVKEGRVGYAHDVDATWAYVHVNQITNVTVAGLSAPGVENEAYNVVDGHTTWKSYVSELASWFGVTPPTRAAQGPYETFTGHFATEKVRSALGFEPREDRDEILAETKHFLQAEGVLHAC